MKIYSIVYLPLAQTDIEQYADNIFEYTGHQSSVKVFLQELDASISQLKDFPYSCAIYQAVRPLNSEFRQKPFGNYNIFYIVDEVSKRILIARVVLAKRAALQQSK